jgi:hypothetical protein
MSGQHLSSTKLMSLARARGATLLVAAAGALGAACGDGDGAGIDAGIQVRADNGVAMCGKPVVYLNFGPVVISKGALEDSRIDTTDDPETPAEGYTIGAYPSAVNQAKLTKLIDDLLAEQRIPVMHTRPTSGDYFMLVFIDDFLPGIQGGRTATNCGHTNPNTIGFVNTGFYSLHGIEYSLHGTMLMLGRSVGLDPVEVGLARGNCMVNNSFLESCTFGPVQSALGPCAAGQMQDQVALLAPLACKQ